MIPSPLWSFFGGCALPWKFEMTANMMSPRAEYKIVCHCEITFAERLQRRIILQQVPQQQ